MKMLRASTELVNGKKGGGTRAKSQEFGIEGHGAGREKKKKGDSPSIEKEKWALESAKKGEEKKEEGKIKRETSFSLGQKKGKPPGVFGGGCQGERGRGGEIPPFTPKRRKGEKQRKQIKKSMSWGKKRGLPLIPLTGKKKKKYQREGEGPSLFQEEKKRKPPRDLGGGEGKEKRRGKDAPIPSKKEREKNPPALINAEKGGKGGKKKGTHSPLGGTAGIFCSKH